MAVELQEKTMKLCENAILEIFDVTKSDIKSGGNAKKYTEARQAMSYILHKVYSISQTDISKLFKKHCSTISYSCSRAEDLIEKDTKFKEKIERTKNIIERNLSMENNLENQ